MTKEHYFKNSFFSLPKPLSYMLGSHSQPTHPFISATVGYTTASPCTRQQLSAYPSFYLCQSWLHHSQSLHQTATISLPIPTSVPQLVMPQPVPAPGSHYGPLHLYYLCHSWLHHSQSLHQAATISLPICTPLPH